MTDAQPLDDEESPAWVLEPPDSDEVAPPIDTRAQELPFGGLSWQNFERLCLKLASMDGDAEYYRLYGTAGQEQGGIDIYVRRRSTAKYATWQSKRHESFNAAKVESAVTKFLAGGWAERSDRFVLCVRASLRSTETADKIEECARQLREIGVEFLPIDGEQLSQRLKPFPQIVCDFFGLPWVKRFCGREAAEAVSKRVTPPEFRRLKANLLACYISHFSSVDPGVLSLVSATASGKRQLQLSERFVQPDLTQQAEVFAREPRSGQQEAKPQIDPALGERAAVPQLVSRIEDRPRREKTRTSLENWIGNARHEIVLGLAGSGKSTLLRFIALDMLSESPRLTGLRRRVADFLPVWVSFAFWTTLIATDKDRCSSIDAIEAWFRRQDEPDLLALVRKAFDDRRLFLLVDGIDEWDNETAANTAFGLLQSFTERHSIPTIMTSRPHGFRLIAGLDISWRISEIAPFTTDQQVDLARTWFGHLNPPEEDGAQSASRSDRQANAFIAELQRNGPMAQLAATPLLLTGLIALKIAQLQLPRNRFRAYAALTKLLLDLHPTARDKAALAGSPRYALDLPTREIALAALAYAIHSGHEGASPDSIETDQAIDVVSQCLIQRVGMSAMEANNSARAILTLGEEDIGILVKKSPREVGFFHRVFQEFLSSQHLAAMEFDRQVELVRTYAADARWSNVILCLLNQLDRPSEVDRLLTMIEGVVGDFATLAYRDILLAEATFGEFRKTPPLASRLADKAFEQIELGRWPSMRRALAAQAIEGLSSAILGPKVSDKLRQWFPRWHSYSLVQALQAIADWPDDPAIEPILWRALHDEFHGAAQAAAQTIAKRLGGSKPVSGCAS
jgi:NACHT domain